MYCGSIVEYADSNNLFNHPKHPYTIGLFNSLPRHDIDMVELEAIKGSVPSPAAMPEGCRFSPRCPYAEDVCFSELPALTEHGEGNLVRCWIYSDSWKGLKEVKSYLE